MLKNFVFFSRDLTLELLLNKTNHVRRSINYAPGNFGLSDTLGGLGSLGLRLLTVNVFTILCVTNLDRTLKKMRKIEKLEDFNKTF